ncbi:MAG: thymidine phosphorylase [Alphaproteobacteria bacterium]|nr:thymidine phosphorylase [Alphaproteobacteria bacterium]
MLSLKHLNIKSFNENLAYLNKNCLDYSIDDISALSQVEIQTENSKIYAFLQIVDDDSLVSPTQLALNDEAFANLGESEGTEVIVSLAATAPSRTALKRKIAGNILSPQDYKFIIKDIVNRRYSDIDIASFIVAGGTFISANEVLGLTDALVDNTKIDWPYEKLVVDHHCLGGIPGNKTDIIIAAIVGAYGIAIPKTVAKATTSCASVADTMGILCNINLSQDKFKELVTTNRAVVANYEPLEVVDAIKSISNVERHLGLTQQEFLLTEVLALKISAGVTHLLIDIPVGEKSRIKTIYEAIRLRKLAEFVGDRLGIDIEVVITDGSEPIGNGIGAILEARDIIQILKNKPNAPQDLLEKSLFLAGRLLEFDPKLHGGKGYDTAAEILRSGQALEKLNEIIRAQGKKEQPVLGGYTRDVLAPESGEVIAIDNQQINRIGIWSGVRQYLGAGIDLFKKVGDIVTAGEPLYRIYACSPEDLELAETVVEDSIAYTIKNNG